MSCLWMIFEGILVPFLCNLNMKYLIFLSNLNCMLKICSQPPLKLFNWMEQVNTLNMLFKKI